MSTSAPLVPQWVKDCHARAERENAELVERLLAKAKETEQ